MGIFDFFKKPDRDDHLSAAEQRKKRTERYLKSKNIPFIEHLPLIEEESEVKIRTAPEIATRILILVYVAFVSEVPDERENVIDFLKEHLLWDKVSPEEKALLLKKEWTEQEVINASWRSEAVWLLLWCIQKVDELALPIAHAEVNEIMLRIPEFFTDPTTFIETAKVRSTAELLDASDLLYRIHWATRNAGLNNKPMPAKLDPSVVMERHYAINWVTFYADEWDEITTDT